MKFTPPSDWNSSYIIEHHKWNLEKWHISGIMERSSHYINSQNPERIILILLTIDLLLSQVAYVKLLTEWSMNALFGIWKRGKNCLLSRQQCGYRSNRSTVEYLETFIRDAFVQNQHLVAVFWLTKSLWYYMETWYLTRLTWHGFTRELSHFHWELFIR